MKIQKVAWKEYVSEPDAYMGYELYEKAYVGFRLPDGQVMFVQIFGFELCRDGEQDTVVHVISELEVPNEALLGEYMKDKKLLSELEDKVKKSGREVADMLRKLAGIEDC